MCPTQGQNCVALRLYGCTSHARWDLLDQFACTSEPSVIEYSFGLFQIGHWESYLFTVASSNKGSEPVSWADMQSNYARERKAYFVGIVAGNLTRRSVVLAL